MRTSWQPTLFLQTKDLWFYAYGFFTLSDPVATGKFAEGTIGSVHVHLDRAIKGVTQVTDTAVNCANRPLLAGMVISEIPQH